MCFRSLQVRGTLAQCNCPPVLAMLNRHQRRYKRVEVQSVCWTECRSDDCLTFEASRQPQECASLWLRSVSPQFPWVPRAENFTSRDWCLSSTSRYVLSRGCPCLKLWEVLSELQQWRSLKRNRRTLKWREVCGKSLQFTLQKFS